MDKIKTRKKSLKGTSENRVNKRKKPPEMATSRKEAKYVKNMALFTRI